MCEIEMASARIGSEGSVAPQDECSEMYGTGSVHTADFFEVAPSLSDDSVDLVIADPPYNLSKGGEWSWEGTVDLPGFGGSWEKTMAEWDDMSLSDYVEFTLAWLSEIRRVLAPTGSLWVHGTYHNIGIVNVAMQLLNIEILNEVIWYKRNAFPNLAGTRLTASHETILWAHTGEGEREYTFNYELSKEMVCPEDHLKKPGKQMRTVWDIPNNKGKEELKFGSHPTQKPLRLLRRMVSISASSDDLLLAPFAGVGSECVAAAEHGLDFIGFEIDEEYAGIANQRLAEAGTGPKMKTTGDSDGAALSLFDESSEE